MRPLELHYLGVIVEEMLMWSSWVTSLVVSGRPEFPAMLSDSRFCAFQWCESYGSPLT